AGATAGTSGGAGRAASRNRRTPASVGGTMGRPSVHPLRWKSSFASKASATSQVALARVDSIVIAISPDSSRLFVLYPAFRPGSARRLAGHRIYDVCLYRLDARVANVVEIRAADAFPRANVELLDRSPIPRAENSRPPRFR